MSASRPPLVIRVDRQRCMGSGVCIFTAPATFDQGDDTKAVVTDPTGDDEATVRQAAEACPTHAITVEPTA